MLQATGTAAGVTHRLAVPSGRGTLVTSQLRASLPGLAVAELSHPDSSAAHLDRAVRLSLTSRRRPLIINDAEALARSLLTALAHIEQGEQLILQWVLGRRLAPRVVPTRTSHQHPESWVQALLRAPLRSPTPLDSEARRAQRDKQSEPGWRAVGRIAVAAPTTARQRHLLAAVLGALRAAEGPGVRLRAVPEPPRRTLRASLPWHLPLALNTSELMALSSWPLGLTADLPVRTVGSRPLAPSPAIPTRGRVIGRGTWPGQERALALSTSDSLRHLHVLGPTGVGKSTLLLNLITQDLAANRGVVVIEPKGDLIADVLARIPKHRLDDVVLIDPTDEARPVGLNPLARSGGESPELVADGLLSVFHGLYAAHWGPRTQDILHASLLTLARTPGMSLVGLPLLLSHPGFRRRLVGRHNDPIALAPFWAGFEAWSDAERTAAVAPVMNKLRPFILRPQLRQVIGQAAPRFDVRQVFSARKVLLVNLSKGRLGAEAAALLGSLVVAQLWQATLERSRIAPERRHPVFVFIDEFQDYLHLPTDISDALAAARGLGVGLSLAHQHLHQLEPSMRSAVLANARSRICFQLGHEDARTLAGSKSQLEAEDFQTLGSFAVYAALVAGGSVRPWCSAVTAPPGPTSSDPAAVRAASAQRYGTPREEIEADLEQLIRGGRGHGTDDLSPRRPGRRSS
ncbi:MAG TPA: type IV secretory system conjugative DNA transfer family protein [Acidimicrobiales bacterium]|nr:type IV secretory system conjugative DNA transfer family protein [Acidimicrobiales bacterium]